jgi:inner membrane transporter RhtA
VLIDRAGSVALGLPPTRPPRQPRPTRAAVAFVPRLVGPAYIVASCASLQAAAALATTVFAAFGPAGTGALRFLVAAVLLLLAARPRLRGRPTRSWLTIAALGAAMVAVNFCLYEAIARIPLGAAVTLLFLGPLALALLASRRRLDFAWIAAATAGVVLLTGGPAGASFAGVAFALGAAVSSAGAIVLGARLGRQTTRLDGLALSVCAAALLSLPVSLPAAVAAPEASDLAVVAAVGVLGIGLPYALEFNALRRVGIKSYSVLLSLDPAIAGLAGLLLLGQHLALPEIVGIGLVMAASAGAVLTRANRPPAAPPL